MLNRVCAASRPRCAHGPRASRVSQDGSDCGDQSRNGWFGDDAATGFFDQRRKAAVVTDDHWQTHRHGFEHRHRIRLADSGKHINAGRGHSPGNRSRIQCAFPGNTGFVPDCGPQHITFPLIGADQREARIDAGVEQCLPHLDERDWALTRMHPGGEEHLRGTAAVQHTGVVGHAVAELY